MFSRSAILVLDVDASRVVKQCHLRWTGKLNMHLPFDTMPYQGTLPPGEAEKLQCTKISIHSHLIRRAEFEKIVVIHIPLLNQLGQSLAFRRRPSHGRLTSRAGLWTRLFTTHWNIQRITSQNRRKLLHKDPESRHTKTELAPWTIFRAHSAYDLLCVCVCVSAASPTRERLCACAKVNWYANYKYSPPR